MEGGRMSGLASQQDGGQFEDALRRLHALEKKLTDQVQVDITELRSKWVQPRVERVTNNTFKLWQVRENLKLSKVLYVEEERLLGEFKKVKDALITASMDDEYFEATKDTCVFLGGKLTEERNKQLLCYSASRDLETAVNKDIMTIRFEDKDYADLDLEQVRASTPLREMEPTPLDRHRSKSREPSPLAFTMPPMRLSMAPQHQEAPMLVTLMLTSLDLVAVKACMEAGAPQRIVNENRTKSSGQNLQQCKLRMTPLPLEEDLASRPKGLSAGLLP